jgi:hypothetical protein
LALAFIGPDSATGAFFRADGIGTEALLFYLTRFLHANQYPPRIKCGTGFRWKTLWIGLNPAFGLTCRVDLARCGGFLARSIVTIALP